MLETSAQPGGEGKQNDESRGVRDQCTGHGGTVGGKTIIGPAGSCSVIVPHRTWNIRSFQRGVEGAEVCRFGVNWQRQDGAVQPLAWSAIAAAALGAGLIGRRKCGERVGE